MSSRFAKTEAGRNEIKSSSRKLPRSARNLLLIIDASRPASAWAQLIHGASAADVSLLLEQKLIAAEAPEAGNAAAQRPNAMTAPSLAAVIATLSYDQLYGFLTSQARDRLGLIKGYKMILDVERCANLAELQALAVRFIDMVRVAQGDGVARQMRLALGMVA